MGITGCRGLKFSLELWSLNDRFLDWQPERSPHYREYAEHVEGVIAWDGHLLHGCSF